MEFHRLVLWILLALMLFITTSSQEESVYSDIVVNVSRRCAWEMFEYLAEGDPATLEQVEEVIDYFSFSGQSRFFTQLAFLYTLVNIPPTFTNVNQKLKRGNHVSQSRSRMSYLGYFNLFRCDINADHKTAR